MTASNEDASVRSKATEKQLHDARELLADRTRQHEAEAAARQKAEEQAARATKELDRANAKLGAVKSGTAQSVEMTELKSYNEDLTVRPASAHRAAPVADALISMVAQKMLKCNSCKQRFKTHVITRCMHLFCNQCLEARIETRQRKCPTCSVGFGATDVSPVYF